MWWLNLNGLVTIAVAILVVCTGMVIKEQMRFKSAKATHLLIFNNLKTESSGGVEGHAKTETDH